MPRSMAQEQSGGTRGRRSLESPMKEAQARTKVVLRHLPPTISEATLVELIDSKAAGCYNWLSFRPGKASGKKQITSRAYINFKKPEDVYDFSEHFDGHVFVNEKGTQHKVAVEYAPYQRTPKPRSKKDIREGTIMKDPDYLEFLDMLGKPLEFLPSAEVQLERREAEKAAALGAGSGKEAVVTPLMEFVRQKRAQKSAPQRALSKLASRAVASPNPASHKRSLERSRSGPLMDFKEVQSRDHAGGQRREEHRKEREVVIERRKKDVTEAKEKKLGHEAASTAISAVKGNTATSNLESSGESTHVAVLTKDSLARVTDGQPIANEVLAVDVEPSSSLPLMGKSANEGMHGDTAKDLNKRDVLKKKQLLLMKEKLQKDVEGGPTSPGRVSAGGYNSHNQRHRPPASPRVTSSSSQAQFAASAEGSTVAAPSKLSQRRDISGRSTSRGALSPREQQSPSQHTTSSDSQSQQGSPITDRAGKRPPRPQNVRLTGKEQVSILASSGEPEGASLPSNSSLTPLPTEEKFSNTTALESFSGTERQDARRVRNKDRPDRPVWTPRRRSDTGQSVDASSVPSAVSTGVCGSADALEMGESTAKNEKIERAGLLRPVGKTSSVSGQNSLESKGTEGNQVTALQPEGGRSQSGSGSQVGHNSVSGKPRYVESGSGRSARSARSVSGNVSVNQEHVTNQGEQIKSDSSASGAPVDQKIHQISLYNTRENGDSHSTSVGDKEKRKHDITPQWTEITGGGHRSGDRRRERSTQHGSRDSDSGVVATEPLKPVKRGGSVALASNEKQVWVAVQKSGSGT